MNNFGNGLNKPQEDSLKSREERFIYTTKFLEKIDLQNIVEDPEKKNEFIQKISFDEFKDFLLRIDGIQKNIPTSKRAYNAGEDVIGMAQIKDKDGAVMYCPPSVLDKMILLNEAFNALKRMNSKGKIEDSAIMIGCAINAIHPFEDGNGRTARIISMIVASSKEKFFAPQSNPEILQPFIENYLADTNNIETLNIMNISDSEIKLPKLSDIDKKELYFAMHYDLSNFVKACQLFARKNGDFFEDLAVSSQEKMLSFNNFFAKYDNSMDEVLKMYREYKSKYIKILIDIFENPINYKIKSIPSLFNRLSPLQQKEFSDKTLLDIFNNGTKEYLIKGDKFSWNYLIKFIKGEV